MKIRPSLRQLCALMSLPLLACSSGADERAPSADWSGLPAPYDSGVTATVPLDDNVVMVIRGDRARRYAPDGGFFSDDEISLPYHVNAALPVGDNQVIFFVDEAAQLVDLSTGDAIQTLALIEGGLPRDWYGVDAAAVIEAGRWLLISGDEYVYYMSPVEPDDQVVVSEVMSLSDVGWPTWTDGVDAAANIDGSSLVLFRGDMTMTVDLNDGSAGQPKPFGVRAPELKPSHPQYPISN